jgi:curved DNA-binding protein CbpA
MADQGCRINAGLSDISHIVKTFGSTLMPRIHTHYDNLKVARDAPPEIIRAAYKTLSQKYHPDRNPNSPDAVRIIKIINLAYEALSDPVKRQEHDEWIARSEAADQNHSFRSGLSFGPATSSHHGSESHRRRSSSRHHGRRSRRRSLFKFFRPLEKLRMMWDQFAKLFFRKV